MPRMLTKSRAHFEQAVQRLPLGVASNFRYWGDERTIYIKSGRGGRIVDIDDNSYVDYRLGYGPAILGYADPRVDEAARQGMDVGGVFALSTEMEFTVAERISRMVPAAELVRFSNSGTEAVMAALRLARGATGKDDYVLLEGSYHGLFDAAMWHVPMHEWNRKGEPQVQPYSEGVPVSSRSFAHFVQANDANGLEDVLKKHAGTIACLLIEPIMGNCLGIAAEPGYLRAARSLCDRYGVLLVIDEVKTGFRVARGGVQALYGGRRRHLHLRQGHGERLPDCRGGWPGADHAQVRPWGCARRHLYGASRVARRRQQNVANPRRDGCARAHRRLWNETARRYEHRATRPRHSAQLRRPPCHERPVFCCRSATHLSRLERQRL